MEKDLPTPAGTAFSGKEQQRLPGNLAGQARSGKLARKTRSRAQTKTDKGPQADKEDATAGDDFYSSVLERFGIQI